MNFVEIGESYLWHWLLRIFQSYRSMNDFIERIAIFIHSLIHMVREEVKVISGYFSFCKRTYLRWSVSVFIEFVSILLCIIQTVLHSRRLRCFCKINSQVCCKTYNTTDNNNNNNRQNISVSAWKFPNVTSMNSKHSIKREWRQLPRSSTLFSN